LKLIEARFVTSAATADAIPRDGVPHVAVVGRSNVGKSSLINALARKPLARTSAAAGKTRLANLYRFDVEGGAGGPGRWSVYLADLPGYGYARGGRESVEELRKVAEGYFTAGLTARATPDNGTKAVVARGFSPASGTHRIAGVLHLVDARHPGLESDLDAAEWLTTLNVETATVATKVDKLSRSERTRNLRELERQLGTAVTPTAVVNGEGLDDLWTLIARLSRRRP
jgi:GTP-binding protein